MLAPSVVMSLMLLYKLIVINVMPLSFLSGVGYSCLSLVPSVRVSRHMPHGHYLHVETFRHHHKKAVVFMQCLKYCIKNKRAIRYKRPCCIVNFAFFRGCSFTRHIVFSCIYFLTVGPKWMSLGQVWLVSFS